MLFRRLYWAAHYEQKDDIFGTHGCVRWFTPFSLFLSLSLSFFLLRDKYTTHVVPLLLLPFLFSPALPLIVIGERARKREVDEERRTARLREKRGDTLLEVGSRLPRCYRFAGINTHHPDQSPSHPLPLPARPLCLPASRPNLPSRALESPEKISTSADLFRLALLRSDQYICKDRSFTIQVK